MEWIQDRGTLYDDLNPVINSLGYSIVELTRQAQPGGIQIRVVLHHYRGIGLKDCELVHKTILPRIQLIEESEDISLEVTSPGINRNIKIANEFAVFIDRRIKLMKNDDNEWIYGTVVSADDNTLQLSTEVGEEDILYSDIKKAKLAYSQGG